MGLTMFSGKIQIGTMIKREPTKQRSKRDHWFGLIVAVDKQFQVASVIWLYKHDSFRNKFKESIEQNILEAEDIDPCGLRHYSFAFLNSVAISFIKWVPESAIRRCTFDEILSPSIRSRIMRYYQNQAQEEGQMSLPVQESHLKEQPAEEPKVFFVVPTDNIGRGGTTRKEAETALAETAKKHPGRTFTLVQMVQHAVMPQEPMITKAK